MFFFILVGRLGNFRRFECEDGHPATLVHALRPTLLQPRLVGSRVAVPLSFCLSGEQAVAMPAKQGVHLSCAIDPPQASKGGGDGGDGDVDGSSIFSPRGSESRAGRKVWIYAAGESDHLWKLAHVGKPGCPAPHCAGSCLQRHEHDGNPLAASGFCSGRNTKGPGK